MNDKDYCRYLCLRSGLGSPNWAYFLLRHGERKGKAAYRRIVREQEKELRMLTRKIFGNSAIGKEKMKTKKKATKKSTKKTVKSAKKKS